MYFTFPCLHLPVPLQALSALSACALSFLPAQCIWVWVHTFLVNKFPRLFLRLLNPVLDILKQGSFRFAGAEGHHCKDSEEQHPWALHRKSFLLAVLLPSVRLGRKQSYRPDVLSTLKQDPLDFISNFLLC